MEKINLKEMSIDELRELNRRIVIEVKNRNNQLQQKTAAGFRIGQTVFFNSKYGTKITGTIEKINRKSIKVITEKDGNWNVSPTLIQAV